MTVTMPGSGHCCVCSRICGHIGGPWYCAQHDPRVRTDLIPPPMSEPPPPPPSDYVVVGVPMDFKAALDAALAKARAEIERLTRERDDAVALLGDVERLIAEREEAPRHAGKVSRMEARNAGPPMWSSTCPHCPQTTTT